MRSKAFQLLAGLLLCLSISITGCERNSQAEPDKLGVPKAEAHKPKRYGSQVEQSTTDKSLAALPGGAGTVIDLNPITRFNADALSHPAANLSSRQRGLFALGNSFFTNPWVTAPASTAARDGLGPLFNAAACQDCHIRDGRGHAPPNHQRPLTAAVIRIALPSGKPDSVYGSHIQTRAIMGVAAEAAVSVSWENFTETLPDGLSVKMRRPTITTGQWQYGPPSEDLVAGLRVAPPMSGLGLLEAITADEILAEAKQQATHPEINGIANQVPNLESGQLALGRFGWKATQPTVRQQALDAFSNDIGITSSLVPKDPCTPAQTDCLNAPHGGRPELPANIEKGIVFYSRNLAVPARRDIDREEIASGEQLFLDIGCASCHRPQWVTGEAPNEPQVSKQTIFPYTDMLLHDMGEALADGIAEYNATGRHWRTAPLWAAGHMRPVGGEFAGYLHDGRALSIAEAILWHGGEAEAAKQRWRHLSSKERRRVIQFINSL